MRDRRQGRLLVLPYGNDIQHITRRVVPGGVGQLKVFFGMLGQYRRSKRTVGLAEFDLGVDDVLHIRVAWVGQDAAVAERARPPLKPCLRPANYLALDEAIDYLVE